MFFRVFLVAILPFLVFFFLTTRYVKSEEFATHVMDGVREHYGAERVEISPFFWWKEWGFLDTLIIHRKEGESVTEISGSTLEFTMPWRKRFAKDWEIDKLVMAALEIRLKGGPELTKEEEEKEGFFGGFGIAPDIPNCRIAYATTGLFRVVWGDTPKNSGAIEGGSGTLVPKSGGGIEAKVKGGIFRQNWLGEVNVVEANMVWEGDSVRCESATIEFPKGGTATMTFDFTISTMEGTIELVVNGAPVANFLDQFYGAYFSGNVSGEIRFSGNLGPEGLVSSSVDLEVAKGMCQGLGLFEDLGRETLNPNLVRLPLRSGTVKMDISDGNLSNILADLKLGTLGTFSAEASAENQDFQGMAVVSIDDFVFRRAPKLKGGFFKSAPEKMWQRSLPISGTLDSWFEADQSSLAELLGTSPAPAAPAASPAPSPFADPDEQSTPVPDSVISDPAEPAIPAVN